MADFDGIVIGAGHNGLTTAAYLARAGLKIAVLERNARIGGGCSTDAEHLPGFRLNLHANFYMGMSHCPLIEDLELYRYGFSYIEPPVQQAAAFRDGTCVMIYKDLDKTCASLARFSKQDAETFRELWNTYCVEMRPLLASLMYNAPMPREQLVDTAYVTADHLLSSQADHQCALLGPIHGNYSWQARADQGFATAQFRIDWERERATCPQGKTSAIWKPTTDGGGHAIINIRFAHADCRDCPMRAQCVSSARPRALAIRPQAAYAALQEARARQHTALFKEQYAKRAGVEGTIAQGVGLGDLRRSRYRGLVKTRLLHFLIAAALNLLRLAAWLAERPLAQTRTSAFARLAPALG